MKKSQIKFDLQRQKDGSFEIQVVIPTKLIQQTYQEILQNEAKRVTLKGFRRGQAPLNLVEEKLGKDYLYQQVIQLLINQAYHQALKNYQLKPIIPPQISLVSAEEGKDWQLRIQSCEAPPINLESIIEEVRKVNAQSKIWTPEKGEQKKDKSKNDRDERIQKIIEIIAKNQAIKLPQAMINHQLNHKLSRLIDQLEKVGLSIEDYLRSKNINLEQLKEHYRREAEINWRVELVLDQIAQQQKIKIKPQDLKSLPSNIDPQLAASLIRRERALEYLLNL